MLKQIRIEEVKHVAEMARAARGARDIMLSEVKDTSLGEPRPARGAHDMGAPLGYDPLPDDHPVRMALRDSVTGLSQEARRELRALARVGMGDYARGDWERALANAAALTDAVIVGELLEDANLHERLMKGLYELRQA
jgi:hypothetical protein